MTSSFAVYSFWPRLMGSKVWWWAAVVEQGWSDALLGSFGVSAVVWIACFAASVLLYGSRLDEVITTPDAVIGLGVLAMTILPFARLSWLALTALSLYMLCVSPARSSRRRGAYIALAVTGPMLWGPALMDIFGPAILQADAILVSTLIGTDRVGNVFSGAVGSGGIPRSSRFTRPVLPCMACRSLFWLGSRSATRLELLGPRDILPGASLPLSRCSL